MIQKFISLSQALHIGIKQYKNDCGSEGAVLQTES